jgi:ribosomal protein S6--L-glutamate ligase
MILSFHPCITGDKNMICAGREPDERELSAICSAAAVILPQGCKKSLYRMAKANCPLVFPNYDARFAFPGKLNQTRLFQIHGAPHPPTRTFKSREMFLNEMDKTPVFDFPFVFKFDWGGEGDFVFLIENQADFDKVLKKTVVYENTGQKGFLIQAFVPSQHRSLRVAVIHDTFHSYWRVHGRNGFYSAVSKGAAIDFETDPHLQTEGIQQVRWFCRKTGINLAGVDLLFSEQDGRPQPLFIEINYFFGRKGLGGSEKYYTLLERRIESWCKDNGLPGVSGRMDAHI